MKLVYALVVCLLAAAVPARAASSFVYVATAGPACDAEPCAPGQLIVFDGVTKEVVTVASLGSARNVPRGMAMSHDGRRLYISLAASDNSASLAIFDTTLHQMGTAHPLPAFVAGSVAVTRDNARVFVTGGGRTVVWDVGTQSVLANQAGAYSRIFAHPTLDRIVAVTFGSVNSTPLFSLWALDEQSGAVLTTRDGGFGSHASLSPDGSRLYVTFAAGPNPSSGGEVKIIDPVSFNQTGSLRGTPHPFPEQAYDAPAANRTVVLQRIGSETSIGVVNRATTDVLGTLAARRAAIDAVVTGDASRFWMASQFFADSEGSANALSVVRFDPLALERTIALASSPLLIAATPSPAGRCSYAVTPAQSSWAREGGTATITLSTACAWMATSTANWLRLENGSSSGTGSRTFTVTVDPFFLGDASRTASVVIGGQIVQFTQAGFGSQPPYGSFDTPQDGTGGVAGDLAIGGWALDDVGVTRVRIFRDGDAPGQPQVYIGDATLVDGARPDVQAVFPSAPFASRAGWGYQLLTNMLPNGGNGTFRLHVYADDVDGHTTLLGSRTIGVANSTSLLPFGTIDTPGQGETVSGTIVNFGWALSPNGIAEDGSTIAVYIDNVFVGRPVYNLFRSDIKSLFPDYPNSDGAVGYFQIDTTQYANGVHTIAWVVVDKAGQARGIGSRYFTIANQ